MVSPELTACEGEAKVQPPNCRLRILATSHPPPHAPLFPYQATSHMAGHSGTSTYIGLELYHL